MDFIMNFIQYNYQRFKNNYFIRIGTKYHQALPTVDEELEMFMFFTDPTKISVLLNLNKHRIFQLLDDIQIF